MLPGLRFYLQAYMDLRFDRPIGMAVGYIPWTAIAHWGAVHGVQCPDELRVLARYVRALDAEEMAQAGQGGKGK